MRESRESMGMPVSVEVVDGDAGSIGRVFDYFSYVDETFSTYKSGSEISRLNRGEIAESECSEDMRAVLRLSEETKRETNGYFDIKRPDGTLDPSRLVKGWAIQGAANMLEKEGKKNYYVDVGGDIATAGVNAKGDAWRIGIRDPQNRETIVKIVEPKGKGIATSGTAVRGSHIWNPRTNSAASSPYLSITVIGPNVYEADRFATAVFAMGEGALPFIESLSGFEAFAILPQQQAIKTSGFHSYEI